MPHGRWAIGPPARDPQPVGESRGGIQGESLAAPRERGVLTDVATLRPSAPIAEPDSPATCGGVSFPFPKCRAVRRAKCRRVPWHMCLLRPRHVPRHVPYITPKCRAKCPGAA